MSVPRRVLTTFKRSPSFYGVVYQENGSEVLAEVHFVQDGEKKLRKYGPWADQDQAEMELTMRMQEVLYELTKGQGK